MNITVSSGTVEHAPGDLTVLLVHSEQEWCKIKDTSLAAVIADYCRAAKDKKVSDPLIWGAPAISKGGHQRRFWMLAPERIERLPAAEQVKTAAARAVNYARAMSLRRMTITLNTDAGAQWLDAVAEGLWLGHYRFSKYRRADSSKRFEPNISILVPRRQLNPAQRTLDRVRLICEAVNYARDLVNEPGSVVYPEVLAREARRIAARRKLECVVLNEAALRRQGYNGLLAVGRASPNPPRLIVLRYKPRTPSPAHLAILGKGVTFDTGGICLKPSKDMWQMKGDMSGAAAVLATMDAIGQLKPSLRVTGIVAAAHNAIGPNATHPGDIFRAKNGKTISVENTDAEGRLILTDALARAGEEKATDIIDIATLTGACQRALGHALSGLFCDSRELRERIVRAGEAVGESFWPLPLHDEYFDLIKSPVADVNNVSSSPNGGAITAALFLREFVPKGVNWAHLDIAGSAIIEKDWRYLKPGATGIGVRTLIHLCTQSL
ncbi:MAG: leucyl aminopeptidase [Candidatus Sumerlaeia bacterium]|nr:leucyl aminopeptidase [Candidatus Sumerlaeia bacterium]